MMTNARLAMALTVLGILACKRPGGGQDGPLRVGFFPNLTHAQALVGDGEGTFAKDLQGRFSSRQFNAGPAAMEALLAGDVDVSYVGPGPATIAYLRSGHSLRVVAGAVSGGAELIAKTARRPQDLKGKRVASPQLGNTQDIALRTWLRAQGLPMGDGPADVRVTPLGNPDIAGLFARGDLEAAWVPEPWAARLIAEAGGHILVDERDLWPHGRFPTTVIVASTAAIERRRADLVTFLRTHVALTRRWQRDAAAFAKRSNEEYGKLTRHPLPEGVLRDAFSRLEPTTDLLAEQFAASAKHAQDLGFAPPGDVSGIEEGSLLAEALGQRETAQAR